MFSPLLKRKSRNLGNSLVLVIQPNSIFNGIESHNPKGRKVRQLIRTRLGKWDDVPPHPDLSELGKFKARDGRIMFMMMTIFHLRENVHSKILCNTNKI